jgi:hypothetical protein
LLVLKVKEKYGVLSFSLSLSLSLSPLHDEMCFQLLQASAACLMTHYRPDQAAPLPLAKDVGHNTHIHTGSIPTSQLDINRQIEII